MIVTFNLYSWADRLLNQFKLCETGRFEKVSILALKKLKKLSDGNVPINIGLSPYVCFANVVHFVVCKFIN